MVETGVQDLGKDFDQSQVLAELAQVGALIKGTHVVYTSGRHGNAYFNKDAIYPHTRVISSLCSVLASKFVDSSVDVVVAPVLGGIILSQWIAFHLSEMTGRNILAVYAEKSEDGFVLKRGYDALVRGKKVLIAEDVLTTGGSVKKVIEVVKASGAEVIGAVALCNRGGVSAQQIGAPLLSSLISLDLQSWEPGTCPLCVRGVPINAEIGKGAGSTKRSDKS